MRMKGKEKELLMGVLIMSWKDVNSLIKMTGKTYTVSVMDPNHIKSILDVNDDRYKPSGNCGWTSARPHIMTITPSGDLDSKLTAREALSILLDFRDVVYQLIADSTDGKIYKEIDPDAEIIDDITSYEFDMGDDIFAYDSTTGTWFYLEYFE